MKQYIKRLLKESFKTYESKNEFYKENNIPTAPFFLVNNREEIKNYTPHFPFFQMF